MFLYGWHIYFRQERLHDQINKDLDDVDIIPGIQIFMTFERLILSQSRYIEKVYDKFSNRDNSIVKISMDISIHPLKNKNKRIA